MVRKLRTLAGLCILVVLSVSCSIPVQQSDSPSTQSSNEAAIATIVAKTVEAKTLPPATEAPPVTEPAPTETSTATQEAIKKVRVAYIDGNQHLWLWEEDTGSIPLEQSGDVSLCRISNDGKKVLFVRTPDWIRHSLWVIDADGSGLRELVSQSKLDEILSNPEIIGLSAADMQYAIAIAPYQVEWVPGKHSIVYNTSPKFEGPGLLVHDDLWEVNADSGETKLLLKAGEGGSFVFSPDGNQIALVTPEDISLINADLSNRRDSVLQYPAALTYSEYMYYPEPTWSQDSSYLVVDIPPREIMKQPPDPNKIYRIPVHGAQPDHLSSIYPYWLREIHFSPDASRMAYLVQEGPAENDQKALHIADIDGSNDEIFETSNLKFVGWSQDSRHFLLTSPDGGSPRIGEVGGTTQPLQNIVAAQNVQWMDAERYLFMGKNDQNWQLRIGHIDGTSALITDFGPMMDVFWLDFSYSIAE